MLNEIRHFASSLLGRLAVAREEGQALVEYARLLATGAQRRSGLRPSSPTPTLCSTPTTPFTPPSHTPTRFTTFMQPTTDTAPHNRIAFCRRGPLAAAPGRLAVEQTGQ